jgi:hypothetical protein
MSYVPNYRCDVFVSFAHLDDEAIGGRPPWVKSFASDLKKTLRRSLGVREEEGLKVYFTGHGDLETGVDLQSELMKNASSAATFVAVTSPAYVVDDSWTMRELAAFQQSTGGAGRVFAIEHSPLDSLDEYPLSIRNLKRMAFWQKHPEKSINITMATDSEVYLQTLIDLAEQIRRQLKKMRQEVPVSLPMARPPTSIPVDPNARTIFLAQVTDDLDEERKQVRRYLEPFGIKVIPTGDYPQGGLDFTQAVAADLAQPNVIFVQLFGRVNAKRPPDLPTGFDKLQYDMAVERKLPILQWLRPDVDIASVSDEQHQALLSGEHVRAVGLEAFKAEVLRKAQEAPRVDEGPVDPFIFINADEADFDLAEFWRLQLVEKNIETAVPLRSGPAEIVRKDREENLKDCDAVITIYGRAELDWIRAQLRWYRKLKALRKAEQKQPLRQAICLGPPPESKIDIGMDMLDTVQLDCRGGVTAESVRLFLAGLKQ